MDTGVPPALIFSYFILRAYIKQILSYMTINPRHVYLASYKCLVDQTYKVKSASIHIAG